MHETAVDGWRLGVLTACDRTRLVRKMSFILEPKLSSQGYCPNTTSLPPPALYKKMWHEGKNAFWIDFNGMPVQAIQMFAFAMAEQEYGLPLRFAQNTQTAFDV